MPDPYYGDDADFARVWTRSSGLSRPDGGPGRVVGPAPTGPEPGGGPGTSRLPDGRLAYIKRDASAPEGFFTAEAEGLRWLAEARCVTVPEVLSVDRTSIAVARIAARTGRPPAGPSASAGTLADLHAAGAPDFGAPWSGFVGPLAVDNRPSDTAPRVLGRLLPRAAGCSAGPRAGSPTRGHHPREAAVVEQAMGRLEDLVGRSADEPPARPHGDLWSGNLIFDGRSTVWVIDPAAHGGHRETDLAMLALFGAPHLERMLAAYDEHRPLATGWRDRVGLHQLHPLLVHAALFGPPYGARAAAAARAGLGA